MNISKVFLVLACLFFVESISAEGCRFTRDSCMRNKDEDKLDATVDNVKQAGKKAWEDAEKAAIKAREDTNNAAKKAWEDTEKAAIKARVDLQNKIQDANRQYNDTTNTIREEASRREDQFKATTTNIKNRDNSAINAIRDSASDKINYIEERSQQEIQRATEDATDAEQQLEQYIRENPTDQGAVESAISAAKAAKNSNLGKAVKKFGIQADKTIDDVGSSEPAKAVKSFGAKVKPSIEKIGEGIGNIDKVQEKALEDLRQFDPEEIFGWVAQSIKEDIDDELKRNGLAFNQETGELDLRDSRMGQSLLAWLEKFVQGNNSEGKVEEFTYNVISRKLMVRLYARHRQSSSKVIPGQKLDVYSVTQRAKFWYDFQSQSGDFEIDPGQLSPRFSYQTFEKLSEGDLTAVAELSPTVIGKVVNFERKNEYEKNLIELRSRYGTENVYLASQDFVDWATPETLGKYAVNAVLTAGASIYPQIMADARKRAASEMPSITKWLEARGMENATAVAMDLLTGKPPKWPTLKFEMIPIRYSAREKPLNAMTTEWRDVNHLAFVITWVNVGGKESGRNKEILDMVRNPQIPPE